jgi:microcystin-dependent protein
LHDLQDRESPVTATTQKPPALFASTYTPNLGLEIPAHGDYAATGWDSPMNNSLNLLDTAYGSQYVLTCSGGDAVLTAAQAACPLLYLTGTLSSDQYIAYPPVAGRRIVLQGVNLNGFTLYMRGNNFNDQTGIYFCVSFGIPYPIIVTPWRVYWDYGSVGPGTVAEMPLTFIHNGWLPCDGRWVSQAQHDLLYDIIGGTWGISGAYFALPDYRGTVTAMADQIGPVPPSGPYSQNTGDRGILNGWGVSTFAGEANHQLQIAEMPAHDHGYSQSPHDHPDPGHAHTVPGVLIQPGLDMIPGQGWNQTGTASTSVSGTGIQPAYANINFTGQGGSGAHNNIQPTTCTMKMIRW